MTNPDDVADAPRDAAWIPNAIPSAVVGPIRQVLGRRRSWTLVSKTDDGQGLWSLVLKNGDPDDLPNIHGSELDWFNTAHDPPI